MNLLKVDKIDSRRAFLLKAFSSCALCGLACSRLLSAVSQINNSKNIHEDKFLNTAGMTCQDVFYFAYRDNYIPVMKNFCEIMGKEVLLEYLRLSSSVVNKAIVGYWTANYPARTLEDWFKDMEISLNNDFYKNALSYEVISKTETAFELRVSSCLWAATFREADASEIGFAGICFTDYAMAYAFNTRLKFIRDKTLMQGAEYCQFNYEMISKG